MTRNGYVSWDPRINLVPGMHIVNRVTIPKGAQSYRIHKRGIHFFPDRKDGYYLIPDDINGTGYVAGIVKRKPGWGGELVFYSRLMARPEEVSNLNRYPPDIGQKQLPYRRR